MLEVFKSKLFFKEYAVVELQLNGLSNIHLHSYKNYFSSLPKVLAKLFDLCYTADQTIWS